MTEEMRKKIGGRIRKVRKAGKMNRDGERIMQNREQLGEREICSGHGAPAGIGEGVGYSHGYAV